MCTHDTYIHPLFYPPPIHHMRVIITCRRSHVSRPIRPRLGPDISFRLPLEIVPTVPIYLVLKPEPRSHPMTYSEAVEIMYRNSKSFQATVERLIRQDPDNHVESTACDRFVRTVESAVRG